MVLRIEYSSHLAKTGEYVCDLKKLVQGCIFFRTTHASVIIVKGVNSSPWLSAHGQ